LPEFTTRLTKMRSMAFATCPLAGTVLRLNRTSPCRSEFGGPSVKLRTSIKGALPCCTVSLWSM
jgi:hypothetical protein